MKKSSVRIRKRWYCLPYNPSILGDIFQLCYGWTVASSRELCAGGFVLFLHQGAVLCWGHGARLHGHGAQYLFPSPASLRQELRKHHCPSQLMLGNKGPRKKESKKYCSVGPCVGNNLSELTLNFSQDFPAFPSIPCCADCQEVLGVGRLLQHSPGFCSYSSVLGPDGNMEGWGRWWWSCGGST